MERLRFSIFKRSLPNQKTGKKTVKFYARFYDDEGTLTRTRVLEATTATKAAVEAKGMVDTGAGAGAVCIHAVR